MKTRSENRTVRRGALAVAVVAAALLAACGGAASAQQAVSNDRTATLARGTLVAMVNATGSIKPASETTISFEASGLVDQVAVKVGDAVKAGDVLARLDAADLELSLIDAETGLIIATANYSRTVQGSREADIQAAEAALRAAQANYSKLRAGPDPNDYADIEAAFRNAEAALQQAQNAYDKAYANHPDTISAHPAAVQLEAATNNYNAAKARLDRASKGADKAQLSAAVQQIEAAKANLARLKEPARSYDIDQALAQIEQARLQVAQAERRLDQTVLRAPRDGVVSVVNVKAGESAGPQSTVSLVDMSRLVVDITVDEIDVAKIQPGQEAILTLDALPGAEIQGAIDRIAPTSSLVSGVVSYEVRVSLSPTDQPLRVGMTANTSIVLDRRDNVLLAPNWAIRRDRQTGQSFLLVKTGENASQEVEVETGLRNDTFSEILSGASEGQVVLAPSAPSLLGQ
jgi:HlyD family secretion protein